MNAETAQEEKKETPTEEVKDNTPEKANVEGAVSGKRIDLENLTYWNVELQEPYFSYKEADKKRADTNKK